MHLMGIGDEGANTIDGQIQATKELGWNYIEMRGVEAPGFPKANLHDIPDEAFAIVERKLKDTGVGIYCFGSTVMNWAKTVETPFEVTLAEVKRAIPRMQRLGTKFIRVMSFRQATRRQDARHRVRPRARGRQMFLDAGLRRCTEPHELRRHERQHALTQLDKVPG